MANISIRHSHGLGEEEVRTKTAGLINAVKSEFPSLVRDIRWSADKSRADVKGKAFSGTFAMVGQVLNIDIKLSLMARPFKSMVEKKIQDRLREHFP